MKLAFLGLGTMGQPMSVNLVRAGFSLTVWNRTPARSAALVRLGARRAESARAAAAESDVVILMLTGADAVDQVLFGSEGAASGDVRGKLFVDMSTSGPRSARSVSARLAERGARYVDAPVSGTRGPAERGELVVLAGGDPADLDALGPVFSALAKRVIVAGPVGAGHTLKVVLNGLGCQHLAAFASMLALGERAGLARQVLVETFTGGAFATPAYVGKRDRVVQRRYGDPDFVLELVLRDAELSRELQEDVALRLPSHAAAHAEVRRAVEAGLGAEDLFGMERLYPREPH
jgi:3-hydroxyisobutyrate dehydrogenase